MDLKKQAEESEELIRTNVPLKCELCEGRMKYTGGGRYVCEECEHEMLDDFGKVKEFLSDNGASSAYEIYMATGVELDVIDYLLKEGRLEIPKGSKTYLRCKKCGCEIRYGKYCADCVRLIGNQLQSQFLGDGNGDGQKAVRLNGKMHIKKN